VTWYRRHYKIANKDKGNRTIAFDFDGVLATYAEGQYPEIGEPIEGMAKLTNDLKDQGWKIIIFTCRAAKEVRQWLKDNGYAFDKINKNIDDKGNSPKVYAEIYVDDRAINFGGDAEKLREQIKDFKPWGRK